MGTYMGTHVADFEYIELRPFTIQSTWKTFTIGVCRTYCPRLYYCAVGAHANAFKRPHGHITRAPIVRGLPWALLAGSQASSQAGPQGLPRPPTAPHGPARAPTRAPTGYHDVSRGLPRGLPHGPSCPPTGSHGLLQTPTGYAQA